MKCLTPNWVYLNNNNNSKIHEIISNNRWENEGLFFKKSDMLYVFLAELEFLPKLKSNSFRSTTTNSKLTECTQFMKILKRHGLLVKYHLMICDMLVMHRHFFENLNIYFNVSYKNYLGFHLYSQNNQEFFNLDFLLTYVSNILNPCIQLKVVRLPKFLQKKYKKKYDFKIKHVSSHLRRRYVYKRVIVYSGFFNYKKVLDRVYISLTETFLNPEENPLHKERLNFYRHTMKLYRFGKLNFQTL